MIKCNKSNWILSCSIVIFMFLGLYSIQQFMFLNNDDRFVEEIASGRVTGNLESNLLLPQIIFGYFIKILYIIVPTASWFGIVQVLYLIIGCIIILYCVLQSVSSSLGKIVGILSTCVLFSVIIVKPTYGITWTITAGIIAGAAIFYFYHMSQGLTVQQMLKYNIITYILCFCSYQLRKEAFLMMLPVAGVVGMKKIAEEKDKFKNYLFVCIPIILIIAISYLTTEVGYSSAEWKEWQKFYKYRGNVVDYSGYPDYEKYKETYDSINVSKELKDAMETGYLLLFAEVDSSDMKQIASISKQENDMMYSNGEKLKNAIIFTLARWKFDKTYLLPQITIILYMMASVLLVLQKKKGELLFLMGLWLAHFVTWVCLLYAGRFPIQVVYSLYAVEVMMIFLVIKDAILLEQPKRKMLVKQVILGITIIGSLCIGYKISKSGMTIAEVSEEYYKGYPIFIEYCNKHPENIYFTDDTSFSYFKSPAITFGENKMFNYIPLGGWISASPQLNLKLEDRGIKNPEEALMLGDNCYLVFNTNDYIKQDYMWNYLDSKYEYEYEVVDNVICSDEVTFEIIKIKNASRIIEN